MHVLARSSAGRLGDGEELEIMSYPVVLSHGAPLDCHNFQVDLSLQLRQFGVFSFFFLLVGGEQRALGDTFLLH